MSNRQCWFKKKLSQLSDILKTDEVNPDTPNIFVESFEEIVRQRNIFLAIFVIESIILIFIIFS